MKWKLTAAVIVLPLIVFSALYGAQTAFGSDTGALPPSANSVITGNAWTTPGNAYASDNAYAVSPSGTTGDDVGYTSFGFSIPTDATINGIAVTVEGHHNFGSAINGVVWFALSGNAGSSYTATTISGTWPSGASDTTETLGSASDLWGTTWTPSNFSTANFKLRMFHGYSGVITSIDQVVVTVTYTPAAASGATNSRTVIQSGAVRINTGKLRIAN